MFFLADVQNRALLGKLCGLILCLLQAGGQDVYKRQMLTLVDLVKWQIRTAAGVSLPFSQTDIPMKGAVIELSLIHI